MFPFLAWVLRVVPRGQAKGSKGNAEHIFQAYKEGRSHGPRSVLERVACRRAGRSHATLADARRAYDAGMDDESRHAARRPRSVDREPVPGGRMRALLDALPQTGTITWIGVRTERRGEVTAVDSAELLPGLGIAGDHRTAGREPNPGASRQLTLLQAEHLAVIASLAGVDEVRPEWLRRNVLVRGINLLALKGRRFRIGDVLIEGTGPCHPCSRMEAHLGSGGYNAMRGHGGITARILERGAIRVGDPVLAAPAEPGEDEGASAP